ncbi:MobV family relaxase [Lactococcus formosensis]|uniref:MobV family relaxase n=1 Tax=Lactococcus formosensis TaxID=1281486 RepID=UPI0007CB9848|nr:MobV family relaxase [Lactococcus formosensis]BAV03488.1 plasmid recombination enzyme [Lactococcus formosensis]BDW50311.1 hypothetical protein LG21E20_19730 [Lactococcus formosensis]
MAFMVARTEKRKVGSLAGYQNHVDRKTENHSNKEIDKSKTFLNYDLVGHEISTTFHHEFMDYIKENRVGSRAVRKDAVVMQDWLIGSSQEFFDELSESEIRRYFETAVEFFAEKFGRENIRFATVHMDEKTPHMHMGIVPLKDGKLTAKTIFDRNCLRMIQNELPQVFQKAGFDIQRGEPKSEKVHVHPEEYKATMRAAQEKSREIIAEAKLSAEMECMELSEQSYELWEKDWDRTEKDFPDFEFAEHVEAVTEITGELHLFDEHNLKPNPRDYPRANKLSMEKVFELLQEKFRQVREHIALQARKMASKASELKIRIDVLENKEEVLEAKLGAKYDESEKLNDLIKAKMDYTTKQAAQSELAVMLPDYVRRSKLNKDILLVPRDKWEAKHISVNEISDYRRSMQFITSLDREIQKMSPNAAKLLEKIEKQRQELSEQRDVSYKYFEKYKAMSNLVKGYEEVANNVPAKEWNAAIAKRDRRILQEREMSSFDIDQSKGMSGPSL